MEVKTIGVIKTAMVTIRTRVSVIRKEGMRLLLRT